MKSNVVNQLRGRLPSNLKAFKAKSHLIGVKANLEKLGNKLGNIGIYGVIKDGKFVRVCRVNYRSENSWDLIAVPLVSTDELLKINPKDLVRSW